LCANFILPCGENHYGFFLRCPTSFYNRPKKERITKIENDGEIHSEYETRILKDIKNTLKEEGGDGHTYSPEQQKLMVWYTYFFLNRGKPSTHIAALSQLSDEELKENVPPVLQRLIETADHILKGDKNENCAS